MLLPLGFLPRFRKHIFIFNNRSLEKQNRRRYRLSRWSQSPHEQLESYWYHWLHLLWPRSLWSILFYLFGALEFVLFCFVLFFGTKEERKRKQPDCCDDLGLLDGGDSAANDGANWETKRKKIWDCVWVHKYFDKTLPVNNQNSVSFVPLFHMKECPWERRKGWLESKEEGSKKSILGDNGTV